jgi:septal ring factor EnvC (AmiA/AmiB activator)
MREDAQPRRWNGRLRRILVPTLIATGVVAGVWVGARAWFDTRDEFDATATAVRETRSELGRARDDLAGAIAQLRAERAAMRTGLATLDTREGERDAAEGALATTKNRLAELRAELAAATADLAERENQLHGLDRCVRGVVRGLNQAAVGDIDGLDATLADIEDTCESAGATL